MMRRKHQRPPHRVLDAVVRDSPAYRDASRHHGAIAGSSYAGSVRVIVREVARAAHVSPEAVRFYARIGLLKPARHGRNGYRLFSDWDVRIVRFTKRAQALGFNLTEIKTLVRTARSGAASCPLAREVIARRIAETEGELEALIALKGRMTRAIARWRKTPDRLSDGHAICHLIEMS